MAARDRRMRPVIAIKSSLKKSLLKYLLRGKDIFVCIGMMKKKQLYILSDKIN